MDQEVIWEAVGDKVKVINLDTDQEITIDRGKTEDRDLPQGVYRVLRFWAFKGARGHFFVTNEETDGAATYVTEVKVEVWEYSRQNPCLWVTHKSTVAV